MFSLPILGVSHLTTVLETYITELEVLVLFLMTQLHSFSSTKLLLVHTCKSYTYILLILNKQLHIIALQTLRILITE